MGKGSGNQVDQSLKDQTIRLVQDEENSRDTSPKGKLEFKFFLTLQWTTKNLAVLVINRIAVLKGLCK